MASFKTAQSVKRVSDGRWDWSVWIEGTDSDLDKVERVRYLLHPSFSEPIQERTDRASKFRLDEFGWGEFTLKLEVRTRDGELARLKHILRFGASYPLRKLPQVFISSAATDQRLVSLLTTSLESRGVEVISSRDLSVGDSWRETIENKIDLSDMVLALVSTPLSRSVAQELMVAKNREIPVKIVTLGSNPDLQREAESLMDLQTHQVTSVNREDSSGLEKLAQDVATAVHSTSWRQRS